MAVDDLFFKARKDHGVFQSRSIICKEKTDGQTEIYYVMIYYEMGWSRLIPGIVYFYPAQKNSKTDGKDGQTDRKAELGRDLKKYVAKKPEQ